MQDDVIKVAQLVCAANEDADCTGPCENCLTAARAAMVATLELAAEALRTAYAPGMRIRPADAADWLQQRAKEVQQP